MPTTSHYALRYPALTDSPDGATQMQNGFTDTDTAIWNLQQNLASLLTTSFTTYTPTLANDGTATYTTRTGWYVTLGSLVFFTAYVQWGANGSGSTAVTITAPNSIDRTTRQVIAGQFTSASAKAGPVAATSHTGGTGNVIDTIRTAAAGGADPYLDGVNISSGDILTLTGFYRH